MSDLNLNALLRYYRYGGFIQYTLQFYDGFIFYGSKTAICTQIGNAVPPLMARAIGEGILKSINAKKKSKNENYTLHHGDSYQVIEEFINSGLMVDHIITDPPYNISKKIILVQ